MDVMFGGIGPVTVRTLVPQIEPAHALMVVLPLAKPKAQPELPLSFVMLETLLFDENQLIEFRFCVLLSLNVPVAVNN